MVKKIKEMFDIIQNKKTLAKYLNEIYLGKVNALNRKDKDAFYNEFLNVLLNYCTSNDQYFSILKFDKPIIKVTRLSELTNGQYSDKNGIIEINRIYLDKLYTGEIGLINLFSTIIHEYRHYLQYSIKNNIHDLDFSGMNIEEMQKLSKVLFGLTNTRLNLDMVQDVYSDIISSDEQRKKVSETVLLIEYYLRQHEMDARKVGYEGANKIINEMLEDNTIFFKKFKDKLKIKQDEFNVSYEKEQENIKKYSEYAYYQVFKKATENLSFDVISASLNKSYKILTTAYSIDMYNSKLAKESNIEKINMLKGKVNQLKNELKSIYTGNIQDIQHIIKKESNNLEFLKFLYEKKIITLSSEEIINNFNKLFNSHINTELANLTLKAIGYNIPFIQTHGKDYKQMITKKLLKGKILPEIYQIDYSVILNNDELDKIISSLIKEKKYVYLHMFMRPLVENYQNIIISKNKYDSEKLFYQKIQTVLKGIQEVISSKKTTKFLKEDYESIKELLDEISYCLPYDNSADICSEVERVLSLFNNFTPTFYTNEESINVASEKYGEEYSKSIKQCDMENNIEQEALLTI